MGTHPHGKLGKKALYPILKFKKVLFLRERERERDKARLGEGQREEETQNPKQTAGSELSAQSPTRGSNP